MLAAAVTTMVRRGREVPMAAIAAEAGVGVATLYRRYPTREALLDSLTERSFAMVQAVAEEAAERQGPALTALDWFLDRTIQHRHELVLPLHGGPAQLSSAADAARRQVHLALARLLARGREDGSIRSGVSPGDVVIFGAMLAQPLSDVPDWDRLARRQKRVFLVGAAGPSCGPDTARLP